MNFSKKSLICLKTTQSYVKITRWKVTISFIIFEFARAPSIESKLTEWDAFRAFCGHVPSIFWVYRGFYLRMNHTLMAIHSCKHTHVHSSVAQRTHLKYTHTRSTAAFQSNRVCKLHLTRIQRECFSLQESATLSRVQNKNRFELSSAREAHLIASKERKKNIHFSFVLFFSWIEEKNTKRFYQENLIKANKVMQIRN